MAAQELPQLDETGKILLPGYLFPGWRVTMAVQRGVEKNLLLSTFGGIGDHVCAEPTIRYALERFKGTKISLVTRLPELFRHLPVETLVPGQGYQEKDFLICNTGVPTEHITGEFFTHAMTPCQDFPAICAFRMTLPIQSKPVVLVPSNDDKAFVDRLSLPHDQAVVIHPGRHWPSKTFPKDWWDCLTDEIVRNGGKVIIIGTAKPSEQGTVDVDTDGCIDLRDKLTLMQSVALLHRSRVLLTNDSSPLHLAATSPICHIGFVATCKHPDYITHWRKSRYTHGRTLWGWRQKNFSLGGIWELQDACPNKKKVVDIRSVKPETLASWLPHPAAMARWALSTLAQKTESE